jgi:hypothetical protein
MSELREPRDAEFAKHFAAGVEKGAEMIRAIYAYVYADGDKDKLRAALGNRSLLTNEELPCE